MIVHDDILHWANTYEGPLFHALFTDCPYELDFMSRTWDRTGVSFRAPTWEALTRHLHPGAFGMTFAGSRTYHRIACAIEDAGLIIHPIILCWSMGSGFPKATRVGERVNINGKRTINEDPRFVGHRYGMQALKPALEPIIVFQKPYEGRTVDSITATGAGALNIDQARITGSKPLRENTSGDEGLFGLGSRMAVGDSQEGRWPSNLLLGHSPDCERVGERRVQGTNGGGMRRDGQNNVVYGKHTGHEQIKTVGYADADGYETVADWRCVEACPVRRLGEQSGERTTGSVDKRDRPHKAYDSTVALRAYDGPTDYVSEGSTGTAARFFFQSDYLLERLEAADPVAYFPKSSRSEREAGLDPRQLALLGKNDQDEATINDGRDKPIDNPYQRGETTRRNIHPCLKPLSLTRYLATLLLPPAAYAPRRLLVPFAGVASEMCGAELAGWEEVIGVELEEPHVKIGEARLAYWRQRRHEFLDPAKAIRATISEAPEGQIDMFERIT